LSGRDYLMLLSSRPLLRPPALVPYTTLFRSGGPRPGADQLGRVHRAAVEKGDFPWMRRIGPIEHRDAALIPRLDHDVAARDRNQDRKSTRLNSSHQIMSYAVFCLKETTHNEH